LTYEASPYLGVVEVTFQNATSAWQEIDEISIDFGTPERNQRVLVPWGAELSAWAHAVLVRDAIGLENASGHVSAGTLGYVLRQMDRYAAIGAEVREAGGLLSIDALATLGSTAGAAPTGGSTVNQSAPERRFPANHLLTFPIRVPPGLFAKRWIVLYTTDRAPPDCINHLVLAYRLSDDTRGKVLLPFKEWSTWQQERCWTYITKVDRP